MHVCTPKLLYYIKIKINIKTGTSQSTERLQAPWGLFSAKFKATANELHQEKSQLFLEKNPKTWTAIGNKFAPPYAILYMAGLEEKLLEIFEKNPMIWWRYKEYIFHLGTW